MKSNPSLCAVVSRFVVVALFLSLLGFCPALVKAQIYGGLDAAFDPGSGANGAVNVVRVQPADGKALVGGDYTLFNGAGVNRLVRLNVSGSVDGSFSAGAGFNGSVEDVAVQSDGSILVGGSFGQVNNVTHNYLVRLTSAGSIDNTFNPGVNGTVYKIVVQGDGKILIAGSFSQVNGQDRDSVARLNADGTLDLGFVPPNLSGAIYAVAVQADNKILIGGSFSLSSLGVSYYYLARLEANGALEQQFNAYDPRTGYPINSPINDIVVQADQRILLAGSFTSVNNESRRYVARLMPSGRVDGTFNSGEGPNQVVRSLAVQADGKVFIAGDFTQVASAQRKYVARLNATGALDTTFDPQVGPDARVNSIGLTSAANLVIGGEFQSVDGVSRNRVAQLSGGTTARAGTIQVADVEYRVIENAGSVVVKARRLDGSVGAVSVNYTTGTGATVGSAEVVTDFVATSGTFNWAAGDTSEKSVTIPIVNDNLTELDERFTLILSSPTGGATLGDASVATIIIVNDDPGMLDTTFDSGAGALGTVNGLAVQTDGKVVVGGDFTWVLSQNRNRIARFNADGTLDMTFNVGDGANGEVYDVQLQSDGKILIGGVFTVVQGHTRNYLARLNSDGTLDLSFAPGVDYSVNKIFVQGDGRLLIGGGFTEVNGAPRRGVARLNYDGSLDNAFQPPSSLSGTVQAITQQSDGRILVGGGISVTEAGLNYYYLLRLDSFGNIEYGFNAYDPFVGYPINSTVRDIAVQPDNRILIGGDFTAVRGVQRQRLARLMPDGALDGTFVTETGANGTIKTLALQPNGQVLIAGDFSQVASATRNNLARFNADGSLDTGFDPIGGPDDGVEKIVLMANGKVVLGGEFRRFSSFPRGAVARINSIVSPASPGTFQVGATDYVVAEGASSVTIDVKRLNGSAGAVSISYATVGGTAAAGVDFGTVSGALNWASGDASTKTVTIPLFSDGLVEGPETFQLKLSTPTGGAGLSEANTATITIVDNDPGLLDLAFDPGLSVLGNVYDLAAQGDGKVVIGGEFTWVGTQSRNRIARMNSDGSLDTSFNPGTGANASVNAVALQADQRVLIGGDFTVVDGQSRSYIARFQSNGSLDATFNPGIDGQVETLLVQSNGRIMVGGSFNNVNGEDRDSIARLNADGSLDLSFNPPAGISGQVRSIARQADGKYLVGGSFSLTTGGHTYYYFIRLAADGQLESTFNVYDPNVGLPINSTVESIAVQPDQHIVIGGSFSAVQQQQRRSLARLNPDGTLEANFNVGSGANGTVRKVVLQTDGKILFGGNFTQFQDTARRYIARVDSTGLLDPTFDPLMGPNDDVNSIALWNTEITSRIYIGGSFTRFNGFLRRGVARLQTGGTAAGTISLASATYSVNENGGSAVITAFRRNGSAGAVSVDFATANGTATAGSDYTAASGTVSWGDGDVAPKTISIPIANDAAVEGNETFTVQISNPAGGASLGSPGSATVTIVDNTATQAGTLQFAPQVYQVAEDAGNAELIVSRTGGSLGAVKVDYATSNSSALSGVDYLGQTGTLTFADGETTKSIFVPIINDGMQEGIEAFSVTLSNPTAGATLNANNTATIFIHDSSVNPAPGSLDASFDPGAGANGEIHTVATQISKFIVGGEFTQYGGVTVGRIARVMANGTRDTTFSAGAGFNNTVQAIAVNGADQKILVGGDFTTANNQTRNYLARLGPDGALDTSFNPGLDGAVYAIFQYPNGKILIGGSFNNVGGQARSSVARLNSDGSIDTSFSAPIDGTVYAFAQQADGKWVVGGNVSYNYKGHSYYFLTRLNSDGSIDEGFGSYNPSYGYFVNSTVRTIALQSDGRIFLGGDFSSAVGQNRARVARLMPDGRLDQTFDPGDGANSTVNSLVVQPSGKVVIGGRFTQVASAEHHRLARLHATGKLDTSFAASVEPSNGGVDQVLPLQDGRLLIVGEFTTVDDVARNNIALVTGLAGDSSGVVQLADTSYHVSEGSGSAVITVRRLDGSTGPVSVHYQTGAQTTSLSAEEGTDFTPVAGTLQWADGDFGEKQIVVPIVNDSVTEVDETFTVSLSTISGAALGVSDTAVVTIVNDDPGMLDLTFDPGAGTLGDVEAVAVQSDDKVVAVGDFQWALGASRNRVVRFNANGTLDTSFDPLGGANATIHAVAIQTDGKILVGGDFTTFNGAPHNYLARLNSDGTLDTAFSPSLNSTVQAIWVDTAGKIFIGGNFSQVNGVSQSGVALLNADGTSSATFTSSPDISGTVYAVAKQADGKYVIGGSFSISSAGATYYYIARLNPNGSVETDFNPYTPNTGYAVNSTVQAIQIQPDARILIGGDFTSVHGQYLPRIARMMPDGSVDGTFQVGAGANSTVLSLLLQPDGNVLIGGRFSMVANARRTSLARLNTDGSLDTGFDPVSIDGEVRSIADSSAGKHVIGGAFSSFASFARGGVARINPVAELPLPGNILVSATDYYVSESAGTVTVTVRRQDGNVGAVSVDYTTSDGTAHAPGDYTTGSGVLNWADGDSSDKTIVVSITNDTDVEEDETFFVTLSNVTGGAGLDEAYRATVHIVNDDLEGGLLDLSFAPNNGANGEVHDLVVDAQGRVVIVGEFTQVNGVARNRVARLNSDGSLDTSFNPGGGANSTVESVALQTDGKILIGGSFTTFDGHTRYYFARLMDDGSLDLSFAPGVSSTVYAILVEQTGQILIAGDFREVDGVPSAEIARVNEDGSLDLLFEGPSSLSGPIRSMAKQSDGKILIGGSFSINQSGHYTYYLARLLPNGQLDDSFANDRIGGWPQFNVNSTVYSIAVQPDDRILIGGDFTSVTGEGQQRVARLMPNGFLDHTFDPGSGPNSTVRAVTLLPNGQVVIAGSFTTVAGLPRTRIARLNSSGSVDAGFDPGAGPNGVIETMFLMDNGKLVVGGDFTQFNSYVRQRVARLNAIPTAPSAGTIQVSATSLSVYESDGQILVGVRRVDGSQGAASVDYATQTGTAGVGDFTAASGTISWGDGEADEKLIPISILSDGVAEGTESFSLKLSNPTGGATLSSANTSTIVIVDNDPGLLDLAFDPGAGVFGTVYDVAAQSDGKAIVVGDFTWAGGENRNRIARFNADGSLDLTFNPGAGANAQINSVALQADHRVLVGGYFTTIDGRVRNYLARYESNGSLDGAFSPGVDGAVQTVVVQNDGDILIGGNFNYVNGERRDSVARLNIDGSLDLNFNPPQGINGQVSAVARQADGKYLIGGNFSIVTGGQTYYYLIRVGADGVLEPTFNVYNPAQGLPINSTVESIVVQPDQKILIGGSFTSVQFQSRHYLARLNPDGTLDTTFDIGNGANSTVKKVVLQTDGKILIGGNFTQFQDVSRRYIARVQASGLLDTAFDPQIGPNDYVESIALWDSQKTHRIYIGGNFSAFNGYSRRGVARLLPGDAVAGAISLANAAYSVNENGNQVLLTVNRNNGGAGSVSVDYATANGTATAGSDYSTTSGTLFWGEGDITPKTIAVPIENDAAIEGNETFTVQLSNVAGGGSLGAPSTATVTIIDNAAAKAGTLQWAPQNYVVAEDAGAVELIVTRTGGSAGVVTVHYDTSDTIATAGSDYIGQSGTLTFADGETTKSIKVPLIQDGITEGPETFVAFLASPTGGATVSAANTASVIVLDTDPSPGAGLVDGTFDPAAGANDEINTVAAQGTKFIVGGAFTQFDGTTVNRIARLMPDGSRDATFSAGTGFNSTVQALAVQTDQKVLVGGQFTLINGVTRNYLARLNADGGLDTTFNAGVDGTVYSIIAQFGGKIVIAGSFNNVGGQAHRTIARLNSDGSVDNTFNAAIDGTAYVVVQQPDGKYLVGGGTSFNYKGRAYYYLARLDANGAPEEGFNAYDPQLGYPVNSTVRSIFVQGDGRILIGGDFTSVHATQRQRIARLLPSGDVDLTFDPGYGVNSTVYTIGVQSSGKIVIGGNFTQVALAEHHRLARLEQTGALDTTFAPAVEPNGGVNQLLTLSNDRVLIVGDFATVNGVARNNVAVVTGPSAASAGVVQFANTSYRVSEVGGSAILTVRRLNGSTGPVTVHYETGIEPITYAAEVGTDFTPVSGTLHWNDGETAEKQIVVPILLDTVTEVEERFIVTLSDAVGAALGQENVAVVTIVNDDPGILDVLFDSSVGTLGRVNALAVQPDDKVVTVGEFTWAGGMSRSRVARFNADGNLDTTFDPGSGANSTVRAVVVQTDGKILIGGEFTSYNGTARNYLARLNANGTLDTAFNPGVNSSVYGILIEPSGSILISGNFSQVNSQPRASIARLNADGSIDATFVPPPFSGTIYTLARQANGSILTGGSFSVFVAGINYYYLARLDSHGAIDYDFNGYDPNIGYPVNSTVQAIVVQPDQRILIGGDFTSVRGVSRQRVARLLPDGSLDETFGIGTGINSTVNDLALQADGKVLAVGRFTVADSAARNYLARLNSDGSLDTEFDAIAGPDGELTSIALASGGRAVIGGEFTAFSSFPRGNVARIQYVPTTATPGAFQFSETLYYVPENAGSITIPVHRLEGWTGAASVSYKTVGGAAGSGVDFNAVSGTLNWAAGDTADKTITIPINDDPVVEGNESFSLVLYSPVGGALDDASTATIVIVNDDPGLLNLSFNPDAGVLGHVFDLKVQTDGKVVIGGDFSWVWRASRNRIARLNADGTLDTTFNPGSGANASVNAVAVQPDGKILIAGDFTTVNGVGRKYIARFESNGSLDADFNPGIDNSIETLQVLPDGKILIGGNFNQVNGETRGRIAKLNADGSLDLGFGPVAGISGTVNSVMQQPDGKVLVGGSFSLNSGGATYYYLIRLNSNGSLETGFNVYNPNIGLPINSTVQDIVLQGDGKILIGGSFSSVNQQPRSGVARLKTDGTLDTTFNVGSGANGTVYDVELQSDGKVVIVGNFTVVQNVARHRVARLNSDGSLDTTFDVLFGPDALVRVAKVAADGSIFIGGDFTEFNSFSRVGVARLRGTEAPPQLLYLVTERQLRLIWPVTAIGFNLYQTDDIGANNWQPSTEDVTIQGDYYVVTVSLAQAKRFYELRSP